MEYICNKCGVVAFIEPYEDNKLVSCTAPLPTSEVCGGALIEWEEWRRYLEFMWDDNKHLKL